MQIDRSDVADELDHVHMGVRPHPAPDEPDVADTNKADRSDGAPDPSASRDSAFLETTAAYRAAVDAAYRQYAVDQGHAQAKERGLERAILTARGRGRPTEGTTADEVHTGARGPASGREFDPEAAGGPIRQLDAGEARITSEGIQRTAAHLQRFAGEGPLEAPEKAMLDRLTSIADGNMEPTSYDLNFYTHELDEAARYAQLGFGPESGVDLAWTSGALRCMTCGMTSIPLHSKTTESPVRISPTRGWRHE